MGARVVDLYAGSGALGFEALSRGAESVTFVESGRDAAKVLRANAASLGVEDRCRIVQGDAIARLATGLPGAPFDLAFADPPYALGQELLLLEALSRGRALAPGARLVFERDRVGDPAGPPPGFQLARIARYGRTCLDFYRWEPTSRPG